MIVKNPLNRGQVIRVNTYDTDVVVENALSQKKQFTGLPKVAQLTQNSWNMSPYTRESVYKDVVTSNLVAVGRIERYNLKGNKYHEHR